MHIAHGPLGTRGHRDDGREGVLDGPAHSAAADLTSDFWPLVLALVLLCNIRVISMYL